MTHSPLLLWTFGTLREAYVLVLVAAIVAGAFVCQAKGKHVAACLLVSLAGAIKLFPFLLLPWFLARGARNGTHVARRVVVCVVFLSACFIVTGAGLWMEYFRASRAAILDWSMLYSLMLLTWYLGRQKSAELRQGMLRREDMAHE